jgi:hypothetical protein
MRDAPLLGTGTPGGLPAVLFVPILATAFGCA